MSESRLESLRVLAVDDHEVNRQFLQLALRDRVGSLKLAISGGAAIQCCEEQEFDVVLMDLHMPDMEGSEAWRAIAERAGENCRTRVIALTADSRPEERERLRQCGFHGFLNKPVQLDRLLETIARVAAGGDGFALSDPNQDSERDFPLIDQVRARHASGGEQNARRMQAALAQDLTERRELLDQALSHARWKQAVELLHQWKGACGYAGASRLERSCAALETSLRNHLNSSPGLLYLNCMRDIEGTALAIETLRQQRDDLTAAPSSP